MARAIWSGVLSFGLVSIPVRLYPATEPHQPSFHEFEKGTADRIRYQRVNERTGHEVEYSDVVKGASIGGGNYVPLSQKELDEIAPGQSRSLDIRQFVDIGEIDPIYFSKAYLLGPGDDATKETYALLRDAMGRTGKAAIASFVMRTKEYLAAVRADGDVLVLETLFFADEIRDPHQEISNLPGRVDLSPREVQMASQLIEAMTGPWNPADYRDSYTDRVNELIEAKKNKKELDPAAPAPAATNLTDLTQALQASLDAARKPRAKRTAAKKPPGKGAA
jgi:DNA end-binding protein Ku